MLKSIVKLNRVSKRFGPIKALVDLSLKVDEGEVTSILGPNGSGKTTLLRIISLQLTPTSGEFLLFGGKPEGNYDKRKIGYVAHQIFLYNDLTVRENLEFYYKTFFPNSKFKLENFSEVISALKIDRWLECRVKDLSHGSKKKADITRALIHSPELLVMDEPFSGLDLEAREVLIKYLEKLQGEKTIIFSSHEIGLAKEISNRGIFLENGRVVKEERFR